MAHWYCPLWKVWPSLHQKNSPILSTVVNCWSLIHVRGQILKNSFSQSVIFIPVDKASRTCLADLTWDNLVTRPKHRSWDHCIHRSGSTFRTLWISQLRALSRSITPWTLRKNHISAACTAREMAWHSFSHYPRFMTIDENLNKDRFKTDSFTVFESSRFANKELQSSHRTAMVYQSVYHSFIHFIWKGDSRHT